MITKSSESLKRVSPFILNLPAYKDYDQAEPSTASTQPAVGEQAGTSEARELPDKSDLFSHYSPIGQFTLGFTEITSSSVHQSSSRHLTVLPPTPQEQQTLQSRAVEEHLRERASVPVLAVSSPFSPQTLD